MSKQEEAKMDGVINPQNYNSIKFNTEKFDALKTLRSTEVNRIIWLHMPRGLTLSTSSE